MVDSTLWSETMGHAALSDSQRRDFEENGYVLVKGLFDQEEMDLLRTIGKADAGLLEGVRVRRDAAGGETKLSLRNDLSDDIYSAFVRSHRVADTMEALLGDEVYHYHHKMNMKEPYVGGAWEWHQDYGYWYNYGCLYPDMGSYMIAVDQSTRDNGCLQVIKASHKMGRIDHGKTGDQTGADMERVNVALERMELVYCEMDPGDALFFHSNLLHRSDQNRSPHPRWVLICCYNTRHNDPYIPGRHPGYSPMEKWPDSRIKEIGRRQLEEATTAPS